MTRLHVLQLISSLSVGGAERLLVDMLKSQSERSDHVQAVTVINDRVDPQMQKEIAENVCDIYYLKRRPGHLHPRYLLRLLSIVYSKKIDVIHAHNRGSKIWAVACKLFSPRIRIVFTVHDVGEVIKISWLERIIHKFFVDATIAISGAVQRECIKAKLRNVSLIYNGVEVSRFASNERSRFGGVGTTLINVARVTHKKKGQDVLLRAVGRCVSAGVDLECIFVGNVVESDPGSLTYLQNLARELGISDRITFVHGRTDIENILPTADIFVLPSRYEGFGLAVIEAMAAGLPVITSNIDGPAEIVRHGENGLLFAVGSDEDLAEKILTLIKDQNIALKMSIAGKTSARYYDIKRMTREYSRLYDRISYKR